MLEGGGGFGLIAGEKVAKVTESVKDVLKFGRASADAKNGKKSPVNVGTESMASPKR